MGVTIEDVVKLLIFLGNPEELVHLNLGLLKGDMCVHLSAHTHKWLAIL